MMFTDEMLRVLRRSVLCWLATVDSEGRPNVSPKEMFVPFGNEDVLIANIASPNSARNIRGNPRVCVSFIDIFAQRGFKLRGLARVIRRDEAEFPPLEVPLVAKTQGLFPFHEVIAVRIEQVTPIIAPSYHLFQGTTEASQRKAAMRTYGVVPDDGSAN